MPDLPDGVALLLAIFGALGLAASAGFRILVPPVVFALAGRAGWVAPAEGFGWMLSTPALVVLGLGAVLEALAAYRPARSPRLAILLATVASGALTSAAAMGSADRILWVLLGWVAGGAVAFAVRFPAAGRPRQVTGETLAALLVAAMAVYAPITVPVVVLAMVAGSLQRRSGAPGGSDGAART